MLQILSFSKNYEAYSTFVQYRCMKWRNFDASIVAFAATFFLLAACKNDLMRSSYKPVFPDLPSHWDEILGEAHWRFEWVDENGSWQWWESQKSGEAPDLSISHEWTIPVLAWPFWPERDLIPGMMKPAGALFPWDAAGEKLVLSWKAGVEAVFWKEMILAERPTDASAERLPWYFDWMRFRELLESENIPSNVRQNLWLADWKSIAQKTVLSGFDRRRIVSRDRKSTRLNSSHT